MPRLLGLSFISRTVGLFSLNGSGRSAATADALAAVLLTVFLVVVLLGGCSAQTAEQHLSNAEAYSSSGQDDEAIIELKNALKNDSALLDARAMLADLQFASGDYQAAEANYERAAKGATSNQLYYSMLLCRIRLQQAAGVISELSNLESPTNSDSGQPLGATPRAVLGLARLALDDRDLAEQEFTAALAEDNNQPLAHYGLARIAWRDGNTRLASAHFERATELSSRDPEILLNKAEFELTKGDFEAARTTYELARILPGNDLPARLGAVRVLIFEKQYAAAESELEAVLQLAPDLLSAVYLKGLVAYEQDQLEVAQLQLRQVLSGQSNYAPALYLMGAVQFKQQEFLQAETNLASYVTRTPGDVSGRKLLGAVRMQTGNYEGVVAALSDIAVGSNDAQALAMLGTAYARLNKLNEASELLDRAVELAPDIGALRNQLAVTLLAAGQSEQAIGQLRSAIDLDEELQLSDYLLVLAQLREGNVDEALVAVNVLRERAPEDPMGENLLGAVRFAQGDTDGARSAFMSALEKQPSFQPAALNLVRLELSEGNRDAALQGLQNLLVTDPTSERALLQLAELELESFRKTPYALGPSIPVSANLKRQQAVQRAQVLLRRAADAHDDSLAPRLALARLGLFNRDAVLAEQESIAALAIAPDNLGVLGVRIEALLLAGKRAETEEPLKRLARLIRQSAPANPQHLLTLARLVERSGQAKTARKLYREISQTSGSVGDSANFALVRFNLHDGDVVQANDKLQQISASARDSQRYRLLNADVMAAQGDVVGAQRKYEELLAEDNRDALFRLTGLHAKAGDIERASSVLEIWLKRHPEDSASKIALATTALTSGDFAVAKEGFESALQQMPDNVIVLNNLAWLYQQTNDSRAREMAERAWAIAPDNADVADTLGWILVESGQVEQGRDVLLEARSLAPRDPSIAFHAAHALASTGRSAQALSILQSIDQRRLGSSANGTAALALLRKLVAVDEVKAETEEIN